MNRPVFYVQINRLLCTYKGTKHTNVACSSNPTLFAQLTTRHHLLGRCNREMSQHVLHTQRRRAYRASRRQATREATGGSLVYACETPRGVPAFSQVPFKATVRCKKSTISCWVSALQAAELTLAIPTRSADAKTMIPARASSRQAPLASQDTRCLSV